MHGRSADGDEMYPHGLKVCHHDYSIKCCYSFYPIPLLNKRQEFEVENVCQEDQDLMLMDYMESIILNLERRFGRAILKATRKAVADVLD